MPDTATETPKAMDFTVTTDEVKLWHRRMEQAEEQSKSFWTQADTFRKEWLGRHYPRTQDAPKRLTNLIASYVQVFAPTLFFQNPVVYAEAKKPDPLYEQTASLIAGRINDLLEPMRFKDEIKQALQDAFWCLGVVKVLMVTPTPQPRKLDDDEDHNGVKESRTVNTDTAELGYDEFHEAGQPAVMRVHYRHFLRDPSAASLNKAAWCAHIIYRRIEDLRQDDRYDVPDDLKATHGWQATRGDLGSDDEHAADSSDPLNQWVKLYEIHIEQGRRIITLAHGYADRPLRTTVVRNGIEGFPFRVLRLIAVNDEFYPLSPVAAWYEPYVAMNDFRLHLNELAMKLKSVILVDSNAGADIIQRIEAARNGDVIAVQSLRDVLTTQLLNLPQELHQLADALKSDCDRIAGIDDFVRGLRTSGGVTATEIAKMSEKYEIRIADAQSMVIDWTQELLGLLAALVFEYSIESVPVRMRMGQKTQWAMFSPDQLAGEYVDYLYRIEAGTHQRQTPEVKQLRSEKMLGLMATPVVMQALAAEGVRPSLAAFAEDWLTASGERDVSRYLVPMQPMVEGMPVGSLTTAQVQPEQYAYDEAWHENGLLMRDGSMPPAMPGQHHAAHARAHDELAEQLGQGLEAQPGMPYPLSLDEARALLETLGDHVGQHHAIETQEAEQAALQQLLAQATQSMQAQAAAGQGVPPQGAPAPGPALAVSPVQGLAQGPEYNQAAGGAALAQGV